MVKPSLINYNGFSWNFPDEQFKLDSTLNNHCVTEMLSCIPSPNFLIHENTKKYAAYVISIQEIYKTQISCDRVATLAG